MAIGVILGVVACLGVFQVIDSAIYAHVNGVEFKETMNTGQLRDLLQSLIEHDDHAVRKIYIYGPKGFAPADQILNARLNGEAALIISSQDINDGKNLS